ncbi:hypothetical protein [Pyrobaculum arsenaticum]|uniref:hypothetical protein n=1 Tax=Pyrobaculum arsenaticum TaxID=121277 RepID=UPI0021CD0223|nr:hypothetical protein [Pyrobaculum arsenaticum]
MRRIAELILEARIRISYRIAWIMYLLNIRGDKSLPDIKRFYAKAMARRWCPKKRQSILRNGVLQAPQLRHCSLPAA